jgi:hypothetical protein
MLLALKGLVIALAIIAEIMNFTSAISMIFVGG